MGSCRAARPVASVKQEDLPPSSGFTNRLRRRFREEREARLAADEKVEQLKAALQNSENEVRRLQEENANLRGPAGRPSISRVKRPPVYYGEDGKARPKYDKRPFDKETDVIFKMRGKKKPTSWNGHRHFYSMMRSFIGRYTSYASMVGKRELRRVLIKQFMDGGGRFYEWRDEKKEAVELSFDETLFLTGPLFTSRRTAERARDKNLKSLEQIRTSVAETVARTLEQGASSPATVSLPQKPSASDMVVMLGTYNPERDYIFGLRGYDSLKKKGHNSLQALARPYREMYIGLRHGSQKQELRLGLLKAFMRTILQMGRRYRRSCENRIGRGVDSLI